MKPPDITLGKKIKKDILYYNNNIARLPGVSTNSNLDCFVEQIVDSTRRIKYISTLNSKNPGPIYADATSAFFDPIKAAIFYKNQKQYDEAFWLVFLATHFGKNKRTGWELVRNTYGAFNNPVFWDWVTTSTSKGGFRTWLSHNQTALKATGNFSNHRKYQSIDAMSATGTGEAIESYIRWVGTDHQTMINQMITTVGNNPRDLFEGLYNSMNAVASFGRTARFDYLTMVGKLQLAPIEPGHTYMTGATGPKSGARLLFGGSKSASINEKVLDTSLLSLENHLGLYFGMQVLEDALCNWQKSPSKYVHFSG